MALARLSDAPKNDAGARALEGWLLVQMQRYPEAIRAFRAALVQAPSSPDVLTNLGYAYGAVGGLRSEEHTSELQSLMRISYAVFCLKKKSNITYQHSTNE